MQLMGGLKAFQQCWKRMKQSTSVLTQVGRPLFARVLECSEDAEIPALAHVIYPAGLRSGEGVCSKTDV